MPMSSGGGTSNPSGTDEDDGTFKLSEVVPQFLESLLVPILRVAEEIQEDNPRVAYLCMYTPAYAWLLCFAD